MGWGCGWCFGKVPLHPGCVEMDLKVCFATGSRGDKTQFIFFLCLCIKRLLKKKYGKKEDFIVNYGFLLSSLQSLWLSSDWVLQ